MHKKRAHYLFHALLWQPDQRLRLNTRRDNAPIRAHLHSHAVQPLKSLVVFPEERLVSVDAEINNLGASDFSPLRHSPALWLSPSTERRQFSKSATPSQAIILFAQPTVLADMGGTRFVASEARTDTSHARQATADKRHSDGTKPVPPRNVTTGGRVSPHALPHDIRHSDSCYPCFRFYFSRSRGDAEERAGGSRPVATGWRLSDVGCRLSCNRTHPRIVQKR